MPVPRPLSFYPTDIQPVPPEQWVLRFSRLLAHWKPELPPEAARRTAEEWQGSLGALGPVQAFAMYRRVASEADSRSLLRRDPAVGSAGSVRSELLERISRATCHSEIARLVVQLSAASGGGPLPAELKAAVTAAQLRLLADDHAFVRRARESLDAAPEE